MDIAREIYQQRHTTTILYVIEMWQPHPGRWEDTSAFRDILTSRDVSAEYAEVLLDRTRQNAPHHQYRLVEVEIVHKVTRKVIAEEKEND